MSKTHTKTNNIQLHFNTSTHTHTSPAAAPVQELLKPSDHAHQLITSLAELICFSSVEEKKSLVVKSKSSGIKKRKEER